MSRFLVTGVSCLTIVNVFAIKAHHVVVLYILHHKSDKSRLGTVWSPACSGKVFIF